MSWSITIELNRDGDNRGGVDVSKLEVATLADCEKLTKDIMVDGHTLISEGFTIWVPPHRIWSVRYKENL